MEDDSPGTKDVTLETSEQVFLSGVIEGFYNRPWTTEQRLDLLDKLSKYKMNSYLYAPKDDLKHRSDWRQLYSKEECDQLKQLITACRERNIIFFYGISPGLDMMYSDPDEYKLLINKTKQIQELGCDSFAILWDDIEPELSKQDAKHFDSFGHAHCQISNNLYDDLKPEEFLFCPVEYCARRADPSLQESEYLLTIGKQLNTNIRVFWTGTHVVSPTISLQHIQSLTKVIKRKPIIWDNLHANDYDLQRVYLGPYLGRERSIPPKEYLSGCMTNPNCEYSLNLPALVTLADWVNNPSWDKTGMSSHKLAVREMLAETRVPGPGAAHYLNTRKTCEEDDLTEADMDMIFQIFWLPHSYGPKVKKLLESFKFCKDHAEVMIGWKKIKPGDQPEVVDVWIDGATYVNNFSKKLFQVMDKLTHITNREMLYDLSGYLNNTRAILSGCNSYLKWIGISECKKAFRGAPTLAGLPGGLAGELARLYPIQSEQNMPLNNIVTPLDQSLLILPVIRRSLQQLELIKKAFPENKELEECTEAVNHPNCDLFILKQKSGLKFQIVGCVFSWRSSAVSITNGDNVDDAKKNEKVGMEEKLKNLLSSKSMQKYKVFISIFLSTKESQYLSTEVLKELLETLAEPDEPVLVATKQSNSFQHRILQLCGYEVLDTKENAIVSKSFPNSQFFTRSKEAN